MPPEAEPVIPARVVNTVMASLISGLGFEGVGHHQEAGQRGDHGAEAGYSVAVFMEASRAPPTVALVPSGRSGRQRCTGEGHDGQDATSRAPSNRPDGGAILIVPPPGLPADHGRYSKWFCRRSAGMRSVKQLVGHAAPAPAAGWPGPGWPASPTSKGSGSFTSSVP